MYKAKADRSGFAHYAACNDDGTPDRLKMIGELRQGIDCEEFVLYYQPKIAVDGGELLGVEALVRWQHPTRGLILPAEFIALAERSTLIHPLTRLVLDMALRFARTCLDQGLRLPIAVNVSARSLFNSDLPTLIADQLTQAGSAPICSPSRSPREPSWPTPTWRWTSLRSCGAWAYTYPWTTTAPATPA